MKIKFFEIPSNAGCLETGTESFPLHFRKTELLSRLAKNGIESDDRGAVSIPAFERHNRPPIRNFPAPRQVWEGIDLLLHSVLPTNELILCMGGDCSIVVGTVGSLAAVYPSLHVMYLDGDSDFFSPSQNRCLGAAAMGTWLLTQDSDFWSGKKLVASQLSLIGTKEKNGTMFREITLDEMRLECIADSIQNELKQISSEKIFLHLDIDIVGKSPAYSSRENGLTMQELELLLCPIFRDPRLAFVEVTEFMPAKDPDGSFAMELSLLLESLIVERSKFYSK